MNPMDMIHENNENMQGPLADQWRALMELRAGVDIERQNLALKMKAFEAEQTMSFAAAAAAAAAAATNPLSPKNQQQQQPQLMSDRTTTNLSGSKRPSFSFGAQKQKQDDDDFLLHKRAAKRMKQSHDALLLDQMRTNPLLGAHHIQSQLPLPAAAAPSPLFLNPALQLAASTGYASAAVTQQLMLSQALANTSGINPLVQQQINTLLNAEISRLAATTKDTETTTGAPAVTTNRVPTPPMVATAVVSTAPKSDPVGELPFTYTNRSTIKEEECNNVACLNLGQEFLPATTQPTTLCDCGMSLCREIGYPHRGSIPFSAKTVDKWCKTLDITNPIRLRTIKANPDCFRLAYWHFREEQWDVDELTGKLTIKDAQEEGVLPDAHLQSFIDEHKRAFPNNNNEKKKEGRRQPSQRMLALHNQWVQYRRAPTLEP